MATGEGADRQNGEIKKEECCLDDKKDIFTDEDIANRSYQAMLKKTQGRDVLAFSTTSMTTAQWLKQCLAETMSLRAGPQVLDEVSFEGIVRYLASGACTSVITMAGAGISTCIPDYRTPGTGLFDMMKDKYKISDASDLFSLDHFNQDPGPFFERSKRFFEVTPKPTPCHYFLRLLHEKGLLLRHYTQNIDTLERVAGIPADKLIEAHGTFHTAHCLLCKHMYPVTWMKERVMSDKLPECEKGKCKGIVKPDIVLYGEPLPPRFAEYVEKDFPKCDLLIIMGTALAVQPFASVISKVRVSTPRLYINLDNGGMDKNDIGVIFGGGLYFDCPGNLTDVFKQSKCDEACLEVADLAGWGKELRSLIQREHQQIDKQTAAATAARMKANRISTHTSKHRTAGGNSSSPKPKPTPVPAATSGRQTASKAGHGVSPARKK